MRPKLFALLGAVVLVGAAVGPAVAATGGATASASAANAPLAIGVTQGEDVTVTVTANDGGVSNATVDVATIDANASYAGTGSHATGPNGTVSLPAPNETVAVSMTATAGNQSVSTETTLVAPVDGDESFGGQVSALVHSLQQTTAGGIGGAVSDWVTANNPGNAPDHAGGPNAVGNDDGNASDDDRRGPPEDAGPPGDAGPPAHAGGSDDANETENSDAEDDVNEADESDEDRRGPPADAGPPERAGPGDEDSDDEDEASEVDGDDEDDESTDSDA